MWGEWADKNFQTNPPLASGIKNPLAASVKKARHEQMLPQIEWANVTPNRIFSKLHQQRIVGQIFGRHHFGHSKMPLPKTMHTKTIPQYFVTAVWKGVYSESARLLSRPDVLAHTKRLINQSQVMHMPLVICNILPMHKAIVQFTWNVHDLPM